MHNADLIRYAGFDMNKPARRHRRWIDPSLIALAAANLVLAAGPARAQDAGDTETLVAAQNDPGKAPPASQAQAAPRDATPLAPQASDADVEDIVVTGSRITGFTSPTPITAVSKEQLQLSGKSNVHQLQEDIPTLVPNQATQRVSTPPGGSTFDLRGLGPGRTLLLIDGRRVAPTSPEGTVDTNIIPVSLLKRVEIVTGGASAAYGSDAVAGAVNIFLDNQFEGLELYGQTGITEYGDSSEHTLSATYGTSFADDRGHFVIAGSIYGMDGVSRQDSRPWGRDEWAQYANPNYVEGVDNGEPRLLVVPNTRHSKMTAGGVITDGPLRGTQFLKGGVPAPFHYGSHVGSVFMIGGDGSTFSPSGNLTPNLNRESGYAHASFDVSPDVQVWAEALYARSHQNTDVTPNYDSGTLTIQRDNAFLPESIRDELLANDVTSFKMGRAEYELGYNIADSVYNVGRYAAGVKGQLGSGWNWEAYYQYSHNKYDFRILNNRIEDRWDESIDAVVDPTSGDIVCRSTLSDPGNGCVPADIFGPNAISPEAVNYVTGTARLLQTQTQHDAAVNIEGTLFQNWAGDVHLAVGGEYRHDATHGTSDPVSQAKRWRVLNPQPLDGQRSVKEGYVETLFPLLSDLPFAERLEVDAAARLTDYTLSGSVVTWKAGVNYVVNDAIRLRATRSRDIRAPNINELFQSRGANANPVIDPLTNENVETVVSTGGNPDLNPEKADSFTAGIVLSPSWLPGLKASVDYYHIKIGDAISSLSAQDVVDGCYILGQTNLCSGVTRDPTTNAITAVSAVRFNADQVDTEGVDIEVAYRTGLRGINDDWNGQISMRALATYVGKLETTSNGVPDEDAGEARTGVPHWRVNLNTRYTDGPLKVHALFRYVEGGVVDNTYVEGIDINDNTIGGRFYTNVGAEYGVSEHFTLFGKVDNLFDADPPVATNGVISPQTATSPYFDVLGRRYAVGVRLNF